MPELDVKTTDEIPSPEVGKTYTIAEVERFKSQVRQFDGIRVEFGDTKGNKCEETLWVRSPVGVSSKLGSFITVLGKNTDHWKGKRVKFIRWSEGKREIELVK